MKYWILLISLAMLFSCDLSTDETCTVYSSGLTLAKVVGGNWENGSVLTVQYESQAWLDTLHFVPRSKDTLAFVERRCPGFSIRNRLTEDTVTSWQVDSLLSHPKWGLCTEMGRISLPTNAENIRLILTPTLAKLTYSWESCTSGDSDDDDDDDDDWHD